MCRDTYIFPIDFFFIKNILLSLQKLPRYDKNLTKRQRKINAAIMFRSSPPEVFSKKDALQTRSKLIEENLHRSAVLKKLLFNFIEIILTHGCASENWLHTRKTPLSRRTSLGDWFCMSKEF